MAAQLMVALLVCTSARWGSCPPLDSSSAPQKLLRLAVPAQTPAKSSAASPKPGQLTVALATQPAFWASARLHPPARSTA